MRGAKVPSLLPWEEQICKNTIFLVNIIVFHIQNKEWNSLNSRKPKKIKIVQITSYLSPMPWEEQK